MEYVYFKCDKLEHLVETLNNNQIQKEDIVFLQYTDYQWEAIFIKR